MPRGVARKKKKIVEKMFWYIIRLAFHYWGNDVVTIDYPLSTKRSIPRPYREI